MPDDSPPNLTGTHRKEVVREGGDDAKGMKAWAKQAVADEGARVVHYNVRFDEPAGLWRLEMFVR